MTKASALELPRVGQWHDADELRALQEERIPQALEWAAEAPYYRRTLGDTSRVRTIEDLAELPTITKNDLRAAYPLGLLAVSRERLATYHESSGTSGRPTSSFFTAGDWLDVVDRFTRSSIGLTASDTLLVRTPYAMLPTGHQAHQAGLYTGATVIPADNRTLVVTHARIVQLLRDLDVTVAWCMPTECLLWAAAAREAGLRADRDFPALRGIMAVGEPLSPARRDLIQRVWGGVPVVQDYGSTETGSLAGECAQGRLHLWTDRFVAEVLDPATGRSSATGTGQLTITTLYREAMPLVRYNLEDQVRISTPDCDCGWRLPAIEVLGRDATSCMLGGTRITQSALEGLVYTRLADQGVMFWRARAAGTTLEIELEVADEHRGGAEDALDEAVRDRFGIDCRIRGVPIGSLVPIEALTRQPEFVKPRNLFGAGEDWNKAVTYW
ncbi:AMP-binding protein [Streptomyces sp. NPDC005953]|uniref:phenylacetate--CoA ligase family protein n=1 Tax=Streptomyces sp. NPDC005953 TaxID=3156719 RepID=UPI0033D507A8